MQSLDLGLIAARLEGLEETIIHRLIDRAQFAANPVAYAPGHSGFRGAEAESLFDVRLRYQEEMDARFGRYHVPEERPYHRDLPDARRRVQLPESPLRIGDLDVVNLTAAIVDDYRRFLSELCASHDDTDDGQYGSSVEHDVLAIQAIARRVHFGALYVAESKFMNAPDRFERLIADNDRDSILSLITRPDVEERILGRVADKVDYIQGTANRQVRRLIRPGTVLMLYRDTIIPLTKEGELRYLFNRSVETPT